MQHLFTVEDRFQITSRGCVLVPGVSDTGPTVRQGDAIRLETPEGHVFDTTIHGLELINYGRIPERIAAPILLPPELSKDDVPIGTKVYWMGET